MNRGHAGFVGLLVVTTSLLVPEATSSAEPPPSVALLPTSVAPPPVGNGVPLRENPLVDVPGATVDLAKFGYVEEELLVSGTANVYQYGPNGAVEVQTPDADYTTRILLRRPARPQHFSGNVRVEVTTTSDGLS